MELPRSLTESSLGVIDQDEDDSITIFTPFRFPEEFDDEDSIRIRIEKSANGENYIISDDGCVDFFFRCMVEFDNLDEKIYSFESMIEEEFFKRLQKQYDICIDNITESGSPMLSITCPVCPIEQFDQVALTAAKLLQIITVLIWV